MLCYYVDYGSVWYVGMKSENRYLFSCLDNFYESKNRIKNDSNKNQISLISEISIYRK